MNVLMNVGRQMKGLLAIMIWTVFATPRHLATSPPHTALIADLEDLLESVSPL